MKNATVLRTIVTLAAVSLAAGNLIAADRMVVVELFTATW